MRKLLLFLVLVVPLTACRDGVRPDVADAGPAAPAGPPFDVEDDRLDLVALTAQSDADTAALDADAEPIQVPAGAAVRLELWQQLDDFRVRLVTPDDRLVPARVTGGVTPVRAGSARADRGTWIRVEPDPELAPEESYQLKLEGERGDAVTDASGRAYQDLVLDLQTVAPPEPPAEAPAGEAGLGEEELGAAGAE